MEEGEVINLSEIDKNALIDLYNQLKTLDESGMPRIFPSVEGNKADLYRNLASEYLTDENVTMEKLALTHEVDAKLLLECVLDGVLKNEIVSVNFGRLLKDNGINLGHVTSIKTYLSEQATIAMYEMLNSFIFLPPEIEIVLVLLYAKPDESTLKLQYEKHPSIYYTIEKESVCESAAASLDKTIKETEEMLKTVHHIDIDKRLDKAVADTQEIEKLIEDVSESLEKLKENVNQWELNTDDFIRIANGLKASDREAMELLEQLENFSESDEETSGDDRCETNKLLVEPKSRPIDCSIDIEPVAQVCHALPLKAYPPADLKPALLPNDRCYSSQDNKLWFESVVVRCFTNDIIVKHIGDHSTNFYVRKSRVASYDCPDWLLKVGSRVIAKFRRTFLNSLDGWLSGTVAEQPSLARNGSRYLIFFDNAETQYVDYKMIRCCFYKPITKAEDFDIENPTVKEFVLDYIQKYPERAVVRLKPDESVKVLYNGTFHKTTVLKVDFMMVCVFFNEGHFEWLYRGDKRLEPIASRDADIRASIDAGYRRHHRNVRPSCAPVVEFLSDDELPPLPSDDADVDVKRQQRHLPVASQDSPLSECPTPSIQTARKSTRGGPAMPPQPVQQPTTDLPSGRRRLPSVLNVEDKEFSEVSLVLDRSWKGRFTPHTCSPCCLVNSDDPTVHKGQNPFIIPLMTGWDRLAMKCSNQKQRRIVYDSPCSRRFFDLPQRERRGRVAEGE